MPTDMIAPAGVLGELAHLADGMTLASLPPDIARQAKLCILDTLGCMLAGSQTEEAGLVLRCHDTGARVGEVPVPGLPHAFFVDDAARIAGYLGDVLELNDLIGGHASIGNVTAGLVLAHARGASGARLLEGVTRGIELTWRVYSAVYGDLKPFTESALVPVGIPSAIGAAAVAAHLLGLDAGRCAEAMAIAAATAGWCPAEVIFGNGGSVKPLLFGAQPAVAGLAAARFAAAGMTGPPRLLESRLGYFRTVTRNAEASLPRADAWGLAQPRRKLHACCGYLHAPVDALADWLGQHPGHPPDLRIEVHVAPYVADVVDKPRAPLSANDARFHLQYCLAQVAGGAQAILPAHSIGFADRLADPAMGAAMQRIRVVPDAALLHYQQCRIVVYGADGAGLGEHAVDAPRGSPARPLTDAEVRAKFVTLAAPVLGMARASAIVEAVDGLEALADAGELLTLAAARG